MSLMPDPAFSSLSQESHPGSELNELILSQSAEQILFALPEKECLDTEKPLSKSLLWEFQERFYTDEGVSAWNQSVPFFVTNSTFIAESYGDLVLAFLRDYLPHLTMEQPVYIVEISAGTGRFTYLLLKELQRKIKHFPSLKNLKIRYVMTDITEKNLHFWKAHEKFQPFIESGMLDMALFHPEREDTLHLEISGERLSPASFANPLLVIANYLFDTVCHDLFRVSENALEEGLISLYRAYDYGRPSNRPLCIEDIETQVDYHSLPDSNYYADDRLNSILSEYCHSGDSGNIIFPIGAFQCIQNLEALSGNNMAILASDKGYADLAHMLHSSEHTFAAHGAFSFPVNFDAFDRYFRNKQQAIFRTSEKSLKLQTACYLDVKHRALGFENMSLLFSEKLNRSNPINSLLDVDSMTLFYMPQTAHEISVSILLGVIRASYCEPQTFCNCAPKLLESLSLASEPQMLDLLKIMEETWDNYFYFQGECRLPFWLSQLYYSMGLFQESLTFLDKTETLFGAHEALFYLMGECLDGLGEKAQARSRYEAGLAMNPQFTPAQERLDALNADIALTSAEVLDLDVL